MPDRRRITLSICAILLAATFLAAGAGAADDPLWMRWPAISPDGESIVFSYRGDLYRADSAGGRAQPLTLHEAHDTCPVWSPDGRWIAFASDRHGNFDVFLIPAEGGPARRLTFHSTDDWPECFDPDGRAVLFTSGRIDLPDNIEYPRNGALPELYRAPVAGGRPGYVLTTPAPGARWDREGRRLAYQDSKALEDIWRKHDTSAFARDLWLYDARSGEHVKLTEYAGDDRNPAWAPDGQSLYYLSERDGTFNVWRLPLADPATPVQVTHHERHPARFLTASDDGDLCYGWNGEIWLMPAGADAPRKVSLSIAADLREDGPQWTPLRGDLTEIALSPTGKELAFIARGEIFVTSVEHDETRRITDTPGQERGVEFSPDGRSLVYAGERDGGWNLYISTIARDDEPFFYGAALFDERPLVVDGDEAFQPRWSPDGEEIAFFANRTTLKVVDVESGRMRTILDGKQNYSYADGDMWFDWSPDGEWFLTTFLSPGRWSEEVGLIASSGEGELRNLTLSGYEDFHPVWAGGGKMLHWFTDRHGLRRHGGFSGQQDVYAAFLTQEAWRRFNLSEAELEVAKLAEDNKDEGDDGKDEKKEEKKDEEKDGKKKLPSGFEPPAVPDPLKLELDGLEDRTVRLTIHSASLAGAAVTPDGEKLVYLARFEKGYDLWRYEHRKGEAKLLAKLGARSAGSLQIDPEGEKVFLLADGKPVSVDIDSGDRKSISFAAHMNLDAVAERAVMFDHVWRTMQRKFYNEDMHGVDWDFYRDEYARFLPHIADNWDFAEMLSEMLGELNASHTGATFVSRPEGRDQTASLGAFFDQEWDKDGLRIVEVLAKGPLARTGTPVEPGALIEKIDGVKVTAGMNHLPLLNHKAGEPLLLSLRSADGKQEWEETVKPVSTRGLYDLLYERWVETRRAEVERLSGGRLGYTHLHSMSDRWYRKAFDDIMGRYPDKEAVIVDTRFNNGGNLAEKLTTFLSGVRYARNYPRGQLIGQEPWERWTRPSIVLVNEGCYSEAHFFPYAYRTLGIGEIVGMPVPGTSTSVWWETLQDPSLYFGMPEVGVLDNEGHYLENAQLEPDHLVDNDPAAAASGRDRQLETAVEVLLRQLDGGR